MDFTIKTYRNLLQVLKIGKYEFQSFAEFIENPAEKSIILRHDVDERPKNALKMAQAEHELGIRATYYFRIVKISNKPDIIRKIVDLGHEIGYHYEDYSSCDGNMEKAIRQFKENLAYFRSYYPVITVCMHGSSMSEHDNRLIWEYAELSEFGLIGEPYLSVNYSQVFYMTDTGRRWDGDKVSVRDKVADNFKVFGSDQVDEIRYQKSETGNQKLIKNSKLKIKNYFSPPVPRPSYRSTNEIISAIHNGEFPAQVLLQSHTLWTDSFVQWYWLEVREWLRNNIKVIALRVPGMKKLLYRLIKIYSK